MSSLGLTRGGSAVVNVLQREWAHAVETDVQQHDDKLDVLKDIATGTATGIENALRIPVRIALGCLAVSTLSLFGLFVVQFLTLFRPVAEVLR